MDPSWQEVNLYSYALGNPVKYLDPGGLSPESPTKDEGRVIHIMVEDHFEQWGGERGKDVASEVYIRNASKQHVLKAYDEDEGFFALVEDPAEPVENFGKADLVDYSAHQVYEIKHANGIFGLVRLQMADEVPVHGAGGQGIDLVAGLLDVIFTQISDTGIDRLSDHLCGHGFADCNQANGCRRSIAGFGRLPDTIFNLGQSI